MVHTIYYKNSENSDLINTFVVLGSFSEAYDYAVALWNEKDLYGVYVGSRGSVTWALDAKGCRNIGKGEF